MICNSIIRSKNSLLYVEMLMSHCLFTDETFCRYFIKKKAQTAHEFYKTNENGQDRPIVLLCCLRSMADT